jgi:hypothetical protein
MGKTKIFIFSTFSLINIGFISGSFYTFSPHIWKYFCYLSLINLTISTIYLATRLYFEVMDYKQKPTSPKIRNFWYHHYYKYNFILSLSIIIVYWTLCALGKEIMIIGNSWEYIITSVYLQGILCILIVADIFFDDRKATENHKFDYWLIWISLFIYHSALYLCKYFFDYAVYPFLNIMNIRHIIVLFIFTGLVSFNIHQLYHCLLNRKSKIKEAVTSNYKDIEPANC